MTSIAEIESTIERLSPAEVKQSAVWLEEYQQMINASAEIFSLYDQEEKGGGVVPSARRGDIWLVDLGMVQKTRPAVILSVAYLENERAVVTYVPRTTSQRGTRFEVARQARGFEPGAFDAQGLGGVPVAKLMRNLRPLDTPTLED